ncbi:hypothetical protein BESB_050530 [Besnoitia besnoiti]|uniref:Endoplasmic reticulum-based factor for assembly of V-ATPase n=1 Tax=Besnoitia besnoiti TaxID=94643 RepID=A0A2A9MKP6_BESBE|nr:hypothetical protein BESB_050530 [Besnoitia besnoiti]PFH36861.1 hypothetical protein BESB_050530 [Besnoitia besnoiti]
MGGTKEGEASPLAEGPVLPQKTEPAGGLRRRHQVKAGSSSSSSRRPTVANDHHSSGEENAPEAVVSSAAFDAPSLARAQKDASASFSPEQPEEENKAVEALTLPGVRVQESSSPSSSAPDTDSGEKARQAKRAEARTSSPSLAPTSSSSASASLPAPASRAQRLFIEITAEIREFLDKMGPSIAGEYTTRTAIDLDRLMELVTKYNKNRAKAAHVRVSDLVEKSYIVGKAPPPAAVDVDALPASERFRLLSEERKYRATVKKLFGTTEEDVFANYTQSMALGVNALIGIFLMFLAGYWVAEYSGVRDFTTKVIVGVICSFGCLILEVALLLLHDYVLQRKQKRKTAARGPQTLNPREMFPR